jgi:hypothetical protein
MLLVATAVAFPGIAAVRAADESGSVGAADTAVTRPELPRIRHATLRELTGLDVLSLRGTDGSAVATFGGRADELVTRAVLRLRYSHSPALIFAQSHLRVLLNEETAAIVQLTQATATQPNEQVIELDPRFMGDLNKLRFQFIGHYTTECEDLLHSSLWAEVSGSSELELTSRPLPIANDLGLLPEPFFDHRDLNRLRLPLIFPPDPTLEMVRAGGVVASWFGQLAAWRGARFPVSLDEAVPGHAVVFATNGHRPAFLAMEAPVDGPTLRIVDNPGDGVSKLLLVLGRDDADLRVATLGLVRRSAALTGAEAHIQPEAEAVPRSAYDAPRWVRPDRPTRLGELVAFPSDLQALGHSPAWIRIGLRIPPDLFTWRRPGAPFDLRFRHNAVAGSAAGASRLTVNLDNELLRSYELTPAGGDNIVSKVGASLLGTDTSSEQVLARIPGYLLRPRSELQLAFNFEVPREGACRDSYVQNIGASIDPDSTIDFSGFPHYAALPELGYFATSGFPFTRYADLSQTIAVLPPEPDAHEIETFATLMGRMGESTGLPVTGLRVLAAGDPARYADADLLVIGAAADLKLLDQWQRFVPTLAGGAANGSGTPAAGVGSLGDLLRVSTVPGAQAGTAGGRDDGPIAALLGFESPVTPGRSVVMVTTDRSDSLGITLDSLEDAGKLRAMSGDIVLMHPGKTDSYRVGGTYHVGELPPWTRLWYHASYYPLALIVVALVACLLFVVVAWPGLRSIARRRLGDAS